MMPSTSKKQHNFMAAVAHNPAFAKKAGVPQSVGKEFNKADKGKTFKQGGDMKKMNMGGYADGGMTMVNKGGKMVPDFAADGKGKMAKGGMAKDKMPAALAKHAGMPASKAHKGLKAGGMAPSKMGGVKTSSARDGIASKGKTKGKMITMNKGGRAC
jgi:hypothetical protein